MKKINLILILVTFYILSACSSKSVRNKPEQAKVSTSKKVSGPYKRKDWPHWQDFDQNCLDTRHEILKARSKVAVTMDKKGCKVVSGEWDDYYYPEVLTKAKAVDIDHLVPLKNAHESGGHSWSKDKRASFANDPENLVVTNLRYNRQKGSKGINEWLPINKQPYACRYVKDWIKIKKKFALTILPEERKSIDLLKDECQISGSY